MLQDLTVVNFEDVEKHCKDLESFLCWSRELRNEGVWGFPKMKQGLHNSLKNVDKMKVMPEVRELYDLLKAVTVAIDNENDSTNCMEVKQDTEYKTQDIKIFGDNSKEKFRTQLRVLRTAIECYKDVLTQQQEVESSEEKLRKEDAGGVFHFMACFPSIRRKRQKKHFINYLKMKRLRDREKQIAVQMKEMEEIVIQELSILLKKKIYGGLADLMKIDFNGNFKGYNESIGLIEEATMNANRLINKIMYKNATHYNYYMPPDDYTIQEIHPDYWTKLLVVTVPDVYQ